MQNVLIVEDDLIQLNMLCECIKKEYPGWIVQSACSYHVAEHLLNESVSLNIPFTLLLLDVQLSGGSTDRGGFFLAKTARRFPCYYRVPRTSGQFVSKYKKAPAQQDTMQTHEITLS